MSWLHTILTSQVGGLDTIENLVSEEKSGRGVKYMQMICMIKMGCSENPHKQLYNPSSNMTNFLHVNIDVSFGLKTPESECSTKCEF